MKPLPRYAFPFSLVVAAGAAAASLAGLLREHLHRGAYFTLRFFPTMHTSAGG